MSGRTIVITGAGRGLGLGLAARFAERGDRVIGTARAPEAATDLQAIVGSPDDVRALDVTSDASIEALGTALDGVGAVDVLINNSGIDARAVGADPDGRSSLDLDRQQFLAVIDVNAAGPLLVTRALLPQLSKSDAPLVVNISSQLGAMSFGGTQGRDVAYNVSKAALNMVTLRLATDLRPRGVGVVAVHPGWVQTDMGGSAAALSIDDSSSAIADTIDGLTMEDSGRFMRWDGTDHDW